MKNLETPGKTGRVGRYGNSSYSVEGVTPQIISLRTKPFVIFKKWFNRFFLCSGMKIEFLMSTGIK